MLTYFEYFLGCSRPRLTGSRDAKVAKANLAACSIGGISIESISV